MKAVNMQIKITNNKIGSVLIVLFSSFIIVYKVTNDILAARSVAFVTLGLNSLAYVFSVRSLMTPFWENRIFENKWLVVAVFAGLVLQIVPFMTPTLRLFFGLSELSLIYWITAVGLSILMFFVIEIFKIGYKLNVVKHWIR